MAQKAKIFLSTLVSFSALVLIVSVTTFSWFAYDRSLQDEIITTSGNLKIDSYSATAYKYAFNETGGVIDYESPGDVAEIDLKVDKSTDMNRYDPFMLALYPDMNVTDLYTNVVIRLEASLTIHTDCQVFVNINRDEDDSKYSDITEGLGQDNKIRFTEYMNFFAFSFDPLSDLNKDNDLNSMDSYQSSDTEAGNNGLVTEVKDIYFHRFRDCEIAYIDKLNNPELPEAEVQLKSFRDFSEPTYSIPAMQLDFDYSALDVPVDAYGGKKIHFVKFINMDYSPSALEGFSEWLTTDQVINLTSDFSFEIKAQQL